jgi:DNA-binding transcriptional ArsR family regulator
VGWPIYLSSLMYPQKTPRFPRGASFVVPGNDDRLTRDYLVTYYPGMDEVFKALADPTRRELLDELYREDGQSLSSLEEGRSMTRFGVMKHLKVLEEAGLVKTRRRGREKLHFLNPVPIRLVHDRWVSKYAEPWASGLTRLKRDLEEE